MELFLTKIHFTRTRHEKKRDLKTYLIINGVKLGENDAVDEPGFVSLGMISQRLIKFNLQQSKKKNSLHNDLVIFEKLSTEFHINFPHATETSERVVTVVDILCSPDIVSNWLNYPSLTFP